MFWKAWRSSEVVVVPLAKVCLLKPWSEVRSRLKMSLVGIATKIHGKFRMPKIYLYSIFWKFSVKLQFWQKFEENVRMLPNWFFLVKCQQNLEEISPEKTVILMKKWIKLKEKERKKLVGSQCISVPSIWMMLTMR